MSQFYARFIPATSGVSEIKAGQKRSAERQSGRKTKKSKLEPPFEERPGTKSENSGAKEPRTARESQEPTSGAALKINGALHGDQLDIAKPEKLENAASNDIDNEGKDGDEKAQGPRGLEPIPQPAAVKKGPVHIPYATLPQWMQNPQLVDDEATMSFDDLQLDATILGNLKEKKRALPIQSAVLPQLMNKDVHQRNDLCVSAATGSGKTFAYVLPIIQSLAKKQVTKLRAVIVVPTRALVKQVVQTCEMCSSGLDIKLATAEGSKSFEDEQRSLVYRTEVYDPFEYERRRNMPVDWTTISLDSMLEKIQDEAGNERRDFVTEYFSKVDILVATPGRLVEHLQATGGFNLDHVEWFIADEADRLLGESYHEWLDSVLPALKTRAAFADADAILQKLKIDPPQRRVTKVLLSATMTSDLSQLTLLELHKPSLILLRDKTSLASHAQDGVTTNSRQEVSFSIPGKLKETAIPLKDAENKPLYLHHVLQNVILKDSPALNNNRDSVRVEPQVAEDTSSVHSSSDADSSDSDSDSSSISNTDISMSDASSVSSTSTTSGSSSDTESDDEAGGQPQTNGTTAHNLFKPRDNLSGPRVLVFTRSTESAARLARLLGLLLPRLSSKIASLTRNSKKSNKETLASFMSGKCQILIATDLGARGLDIEGLEHVINYDVPNTAMAYVHRVGRTARAGKSGQAWTLVEHKQGKWFWEVIGGKATKCEISRHGSVQKLHIELEGSVKEKYEAALQKLGEDVRNG